MCTLNARDVGRCQIPAAVAVHHVFLLMLTAARSSLATESARVEKIAAGGSAVRKVGHAP